MSEDRSQFIGGSDSAAILGISPWRTPYQVWEEKVGLTQEAPDPEREQRLERGKMLEPYVIEMLRRQRGIVAVATNRRYFDSGLPFLSSEIDAETADGTNLEIKTVSPFAAAEWGEEGSDEIPLHYQAQAMHNLMVTGRVLCIFGVLIGADDLRTYQLRRDDEIIRAMREKEAEFWGNVQRRQPPELVNLADVERVFRVDRGTAVEATPEIFLCSHRLQQYWAEIARIEKMADAEELAIKKYMAESATLTFGDRTLATWKTQRPRRFSESEFRKLWPGMYEQFKRESESRVFRLKKEKEAK